MISRFLPYLAVLGLAVAPAAAQETTNWQIDAAHSSTQFAVRHMMVSTVRGQFTKLSGTVNWDGKDFAAAVVDVVIDAASIDTREPKRDAHLKSPDFFDVAKYPTLSFKSSRIEPAGGGRLRMTGDLTIHGVTKPVTFDVTAPAASVTDPGGNQRVGASATSTINRKDFGLLWNKTLDSGGVLVSDDVAITVDLEMFRRTAAAGHQ